MVERVGWEEAFRRLRVRNLTVGGLAWAAEVEVRRLRRGRNRVRRGVDRLESPKSGEDQRGGSEGMGVARSRAMAVARVEQAEAGRGRRRRQGQASQRSSITSSVRVLATTR